MANKKRGAYSGTPQKSARPGRVTYVAMDEAVAELPLTPTRRKVNVARGMKLAGMTLAIAAVAAGCAYSAAAYYYSGHFFPGTTINGVKAANMTPIEVEEAIAAQVNQYNLQVIPRNLEPQTITGESINYQYASDGTVLRLLKKQSPFAWVKGLFEETTYVFQTDATYDKELLETQVRSLEAAREENQYPAVNAYVAYQDDAFTIIPETEGTELSVKNAYAALDAAIDQDLPSLELGSVPEVYAPAEVTSTTPELIQTCEAYNNMANASITYQFGEQTVTLDAATIKTWLQFDEKGQLVQDSASFQQKAQEFVASLAAQYDTVGTERPFDTTSGRTVYVRGSAYGWQIDQAAETAQLIAEIQSGTHTTREPMYSMRANSHGYNDFGDTYIEVDMGYQYMYYYKNGQIIMDSPIVSGLMSDYSRQTPSGVYTLYYKKSPDVLRGAMRPDGTYEYEQPVSYWMPFNGGVGFHDATWQSYFGGDRYLYAGSHGCINLPYNSAAALYSLIEYNVPILCFY